MSSTLMVDDCFFLMSVIGALVGALLSLELLLFCLAWSFLSCCYLVGWLSTLWFKSLRILLIGMLKGCCWLFLNLRCGLPPAPSKLYPALCPGWLGALNILVIEVSSISTSSILLLWVMLSNWDLVSFGFAALPPPWRCSICWSIPPLLVFITYYGVVWELC